MLNPTQAGLATLLITKNQEMPDRILAMLGASTTGPTAMINVLSLKRQVDRIEELETQVKVLSASKPGSALPTATPAPTSTSSPPLLGDRVQTLETQVRDLTAEREDLKKRIAELEKKLK